MKILITGSNGQVGSKIVQLCQEKELNYLAFNKSELDITDEKGILNLVSSSQPSVIVNAAAFTNVDAAETEELLAYSINSKGPENLAKICNKLSIPLIHISTDYVFDGKKSSPYHENDVTNPINVYGRTKLKGEELISLFNDNYIILRTSWVFNEIGNNFMNKIIDLSMNQKYLDVVGDQLGGPTSAKSIAEAILKICDFYHINNEIKSGIYHFSGYKHTSWYEFAKYIIDVAFDEGLLPYKPHLKEITTKDFPSKSTKPMNSSLSCDKIISEFGVKISNWQEDVSFILKNYAE